MRSTRILALAAIWTSHVRSHVASAFSGHHVALNESQLTLAPRDGGAGKIFLYLTLEDSMFAKENRRNAEHTMLFVGGNDDNGPLKIEIGVTDENKLFVDVLDLTKRYQNFEPMVKELKPRWDIGVTGLDNKQFIDPDTGDGFIRDAWQADVVYGHDIPNHVNTCHEFIKRLVIGGLKQPEFPKEAEDLVQRYHSIATETGLASLSDGDIISFMKLTEAGSTHAENRVVKVWPVPANLCGGGARMSKRKAHCSQDRAALTAEAARPVWNEAAAQVARKPEWTQNFLLTGQDDMVDKTQLAEYLEKTQTIGTVSTYVRTAGIRSKFTTVAKVGVTAAGIAGLVVGAAFVILDFINGQWAGATVGTVGLLAGVAAGMAVSGPMGWLIGGVIMAFFMILPTAFEKPHDPAPRSNPQGVIQFAMFGDKDHTGNEQCQKGTDKVPGNKDCQALYGAGTLVKALELTNFDAVVFLMLFNDGYPMSISDMAKAWYVADPYTDKDGNDKEAVIRCKNAKLSPSRPDQVATPAGVSNRRSGQNIELGDLGKVDQLWGRIDDNKHNGPCKITVLAGNQDEYGTTANGMPSYIECPVSDPKDVAPMDQPFKTLDLHRYLCLYHERDAGTCYPPGTYKPQSGMGLESDWWNGLTVPNPKWSLHLHFLKPQTTIVYTPEIVDRIYQHNQNIEHKSKELDQFAQDMRDFHRNEEDKSYMEVLAPDDGPDPVCCLFAGVQFSGNVVYYGEGAGHLLPQWVNKAQSLSCHGGARIWIYDNDLNDNAYYDANVGTPDLGSIPYGKDKGTWANQIDAVWVRRAPNM